ncbi:MAG: hypothetical protein R2882_06715 [Gemmatimonadales bacterium]
MVDPVDHRPEHLLHYGEIDDESGGRIGTLDHDGDHVGWPLGGLLPSWPGIVREVGGGRRSDRSLDTEARTVREAGNPSSGVLRPPGFDAGGGARNGARVRKKVTAATTRPATVTTRIERR